MAPVTKKINMVANSFPCPKEDPAQVDEIIEGIRASVAMDKNWMGRIGVKPAT